MAIQIGGKDIAGLVVGTSSGNKDVVEVWQGSSSGNKLIWQKSIPDPYVLATSADFNGAYERAFRYIGTHEYVIIPDAIKGRRLTTYFRMFNISYITGLKGVRSYNKNITDMSEMFYDCAATELDLSGFDTSNVTNMSGMFKSSKMTVLDLSSFDTTKVTNMGWMFQYCAATTGYARTQADADRFNRSSNKPSALRFVVKP